MLVREGSEVKKKKQRGGEGGGGYFLGERGGGFSRRYENHLCGENRGRKKKGIRGQITDSYNWDWL